MREMLNDKGFFFAILGTCVLTILVVLRIANPEILYGWLGGMAGPAGGKLMGRKASKPEAKPDA